MTSTSTTETVFICCLAVMSLMPEASSLHRELSPELPRDLSSGLPVPDTYSRLVLLPKKSDRLRFSPEPSREKFLIMAGDQHAQAARVGSEGPQLREIATLSLSLGRGSSKDDIRRTMAERASKVKRNLLFN